MRGYGLLLLLSTLSSAFGQSYKAKDDCLVQVMNLIQNDELMAAENASYREYKRCKNEGRCIEEIEHLQDVRIKRAYGYETDPRVKARKEAFRRQCEALGARLCGGDSNSFATFVIKGREKPNVVYGLHPLCLPAACATARQFYGIKAFIEKALHKGSNAEYLSIEPDLTCSDGTRLVGNEAHESEDTQKTSFSFDLKEVFLLIGGILAFVISLLILCIIIRRQRQRIRLLEGPLSKKDGLVEKFYTTEELSSSVLQACLSETNIRADEISVYEVIGKGAFASVYRGKYLGSIVAIKVSHCPWSTNAEEARNFENEIKLLFQLQHPNIVHFIGTSNIPNCGLCIITEFMAHGDLTSLLQKCYTKELQLPWSDRNDPQSFTKYRIALDIISGLAYLHGLRVPVIHRDLKSRNILISENNQAKLADFGLSRSVSLELTMSCVGTKLWLAPEIYKGEKFDEKADVFSFGVVLTELDTERLPYADYGRDQFDDDGNPVKITPNALSNRIAYDGLRPSFRSTCPSEIRNLALRCMNNNSSQRPSAAVIVEILTHMRF